MFRWFVNFFLKSFPRRSSGCVRSHRSACVTRPPALSILPGNVARVLAEGPVPGNGPSPGTSRTCSPLAKRSPGEREKRPCRRIATDFDGRAVNLRSFASKASLQQGGKTDGAAAPDEISNENLSSLQQRFENLLTCTSIFNREVINDSFPMYIKINYDVLS